MIIQESHYTIHTWPERDGALQLVLRPLSAALRDGQRVYAVIRGSACNQDGRTSGITVPSGDAQVAVMQASHWLEHGPAEQVLTQPRHAYTRALLAALWPARKL